MGDRSGHAVILLAEGELQDMSEWIGSIGVPAAILFALGVAVWRTWKLLAPLIVAALKAHIDLVTSARENLEAQTRQIAALGNATDAQTALITKMGNALERQEQTLARMLELVGLVSDRMHRDREQRPPDHP